MAEELSPGWHLFDDDGNELDPNLIVKPSLCVTCVNGDVEDPEEDMLCLLNRWDQRNDEDFKCGQYVPKKRD
ncbi:MAG TPA: hypothetical protein VGP72_22975 [Planctomycetota bacterium]|jgi:hypothetical protein